MSQSDQIKRLHQRLREGNYSPVNHGFKETVSGFAGLESLMTDDYADTAPVGAPSQTEMVTAVTAPWDERNLNQRYCPVYISRDNSGRRKYVAYITGVIDDVDQYVDVIDTLFSANDGDMYVIYIDSPGGRISAGSIIASAIHHSKAEVFTVARGLCASAAALIHNAAPAGHALVDLMAVLMIHMSSHSDAGVSTFIQERAANQVRYVNEVLLERAVEMGYISTEELTAINNGEEIYISAAEFNERVHSKILAEA